MAVSGLRCCAQAFSSCGARAYLHRGMWDLPGPGLQPVSPALADGFLTTAPPGKPPEMLIQVQQVVLVTANPNYCRLPKRRPCMHHQQFLWNCGVGKGLIQQTSINGDCGMGAPHGWGTASCH